MRRSLISRPGSKFEEGTLVGLPSAAVAMILRRPKVGDDLDALVVKRKAIDRDPWSGHMALPGGRTHPEDTTSLVTARREVLEETNIDIERCEILGTLDEVVPGNINIRVTPFVAFATSEVDVKLNLSELADYFWIPLKYFRDRRNLAVYSVERFGKRVEVPSYPYLGKHIIWGMTLKIIEDFLSKTT